VGIRRPRALFLRAGFALVLVLAFAATVTASQGPRFRVQLSGANEVPAADPDGSGRATVWIDAAAGEVCFDIRVSNTGTPNRAHIHVGAAGANGGIVVPFFELVGLAADPLNDVLEDKGRVEGCVEAEPELLATIAANPEGYYVNLHNARFPGGAVRGQLDN
jgi:hypothetical protein